MPDADFLQTEINIGKRMAGFIGHPFSNYNPIINN